MADILDPSSKRFWVAALIVAIAASAGALVLIARAPDPRSLWLTAVASATLMAGLVLYKKARPDANFGIAPYLVGGLGCVVLPTVIASVLQWPLDSTQLFFGITAGVCLSGVLLSVEALFLPGR